ncbi:uncharacterized protein C16orf52 homolog B-like isoform X1 [Varroa jacobsoni]|uniref:Uncharacterized protein n=1 Tax=Varroa destructor TaxID=109461 RepID=A0A7M7KL60_VARDE|nr:uncharacterized protein C16orf52 homolog B-like isoform X2 [Varroa destructor]XP_022711425.1 uncharacterized protein C16orf52 homolog B-like isoform X1 [Varroa jacobsoni]XP_022711426.1 uncharacterized protein C16orf52 homolog B-like isoform X1 [Varroa jacobsoni]XP_022711427.1 uncharacterized protein C16orf52 homolog B-like isoform X1 [Varroa jacobsoni]XP_022711428.1 uncharacterized protein C16orf52 homolog B-like isoform X1 [Varroa jacobsoni]
MMDKLTLVSGTLFLSANVFAILSLVLPEWIVSEVGGDTRLGLLQTCLSINGRPGLTCYPPKLQPEWMLTLVCIIIGCICITATTILLAISHRNLGIVHYARWMGFAAMVLFCIAAVVFPVGFGTEQIGGEAYQLPSSHQVGISYILFILALWVTVISELFAGKVCMPHF